MKTAYRCLFALLVVGLLLPCQYVKAEQYDEIVQEVNFAAIGAADEVQNNLDENAQTNFDTWDPVPSGVWFGGWPVESRLRLSEVPDDDFQIALTTVCRFGSDIIMSGAARTLVRLPVHTSDDPWTSAKLYVYEIDQTSNWTFSRIISSGSVGAALDDMKINFTTGTHELVFWSPLYDPADISPTDGNDHFTRSSRTYAFVDAPLKPDTFYLFVTYVWFASDKYVEFYLQPDTLDSEAEWNRSSIAIYNEQAPDLYSLDVTNLNVSCGYSFDFRHGFGNSAYAMNTYWVSGDEIEFFVYQDPDTIDVNHYFSFMLPYRAALDNVSWDIVIRSYHPDTGASAEIMVFNDWICNDFILISMEQTWTTNLTAKGETFDGWLQISCEVKNETRVWFPLWDIPTTQRMNDTWGSNAIMTHIWDSPGVFNYSLEQFVQVQYDAGTYYNYHWMVQASCQWNNFYWQRHTPVTGSTDDVDLYENMTLTSKIIYSFGSFLIRAGDYIATINPTVGNTLRAVGAGAQMVALANVVPDFAGNALDFLWRVRDALVGIGQWVWRAAQSAVGYLRWFVETITYFASIILAFVLIIAAVIILMVPMWFAAKLGMIIVNAARGRRKAAIDEMTAMINLTTSTISGGRGS